MLVNYKKCLYCGNTKFLKYKTQTSKFNFYIKAIISDLKISLKRIKVFESGHPMPDTAGMKAANNFISSINNLNKDDLLLC